MGSVIAVLVRLVWSLTIGLPFFLVGLVLFLILDIFAPNTDLGYRVLAKLYQWGSCYWFKGIKIRTDDYRVGVTKIWDSYVILNDGSIDLADEAVKEGKPVVAEWKENMGRILKSSRLPGKWVDDEHRRMLKKDWETLVNLKLRAAGLLHGDGSGEKMSPQQFGQQEEKCIARIVTWQKSE